MEVHIAYSTLKLVFAETGPAPTVELGPLPEVRIDGEALRAERGGEVLARHRRHAWLLQERCSFRLDFSMADGIAYGDGAICANLDLETQRWYDHRGQRYWPELVVKSASAP
jgi:hypothetical protein